MFLPLFLHHCFCQCRCASDLVGPIAAVVQLTMARTTSAFGFSKSAEKNAIVLADSTGHFFTRNGELWRVVKPFSLVYYWCPLFYRNHSKCSCHCSCITVNVHSCHCSCITVNVRSCHCSCITVNVSFCQCS